MTTPVRARVAVAVLFGVNGALFANVVPRLPDLKAALELSNTGFGVAVAAYPAGSLLLGLAGGVLVGRFPSRVVAPVAAAAVAANLLLIGLAPTAWVFAAALFLAGSLDAIADVANNTHSLRVERVYGRSILNGLHAVWSIGAVAGAAMGAGAIALGLSVPVHLGLAALLLGGTGLACSTLLLPGRDDEVVGDHADVARPVLRGRRHVALLLLALGLCMAAAQLQEDTAAQWSALYLRDLGATAAMAGLGFVALQAAQVVGRFLGDPAVSRWGDRAVARGGTALAATAMAATLLVGTPVATVVGLAVVGLGIGTLYPGAVRAADALPGLRAGHGIALVSTVNRVVSLVSPPVVGVVADGAGLRVGLVVMPVMAAVAFVLSGAFPALRR